MIQEYLVHKDLRDKIDKNYSEKINVEERIFTQDYYIISYSTKGNSEDDAKLLSEIDSVMENVEHITLVNESAAYFNKRLYPLINEFERSLRKILYLSNCRYVSEGNESKMDALETLEFGPLFDMLFTDELFIKDCKELFKNKITWKITQSEAISEIEKLNENILWDKLGNKELCPTLRKNFRKVKDYRNDIMHAHNINSSDYSAAKKLYEKINTELRTAIADITGQEMNQENVSYAFFEAMEEALKKLEIPMPTIDPKVFEAVSTLQKPIELDEKTLSTLSLLANIFKQ